MSEELDLELNLDEFEEGELEEDDAVELSDDAIETVSGGKGTKLSTDKTDLFHYRGNFIKKHVCNVKKYDASSELTLRMSPNGQVLYGYGWQNGDVILVNKKKATRSGKWVFAYSTKKGGAYGYVNRDFIR